ncbi:leucine-rich repeat domain-containing protein [Blastococcus goldschmidtiae]|uniref:Leucine-rich repeat domain-containing protein n=1 Tax=Blastococcus goldschmidtiae TaxID=3075546 RepID=A0ABU2K585_9ACTN|nr:leucine-rich repeat domain-containing protein [Blastococcus sp. DSM 46792]MDT0275355.1 leucine-rich repeat domain-containing protein [Blastococcus sp. DSM 46792]
MERAGWRSRDPGSAELACSPGGAAIPRILDLTCALLALAGAAVALAVRSPGESSSPVVLAAALCAAPLLVRAAWRVPAGRLWPTVTALGAALVLLGLIGNAGRDVLALVDPATPPRVIAYEAAATTAPLGWAAGGLALVLAGLALRTADRVLGVLSAVVGVLLSASVAAVLLARSVAASTSSVITVDRPRAGLAVLVLLAGLFLAVEAASRRTVPLPRPQRDVGPARSAAGAVRWTAVAAVLALVAGAGLWAWSWFGTGTEPARVIVDDALAACVAAAAGLPGATDGVSDRDLSAIRDLTCTPETSALGPVRSLEGIQRLPNLGELDLSGNGLTDISPLASLPQLRILTLSRNQVSDISPLAALARLGTLTLTGNQVSDIGPLAGLPLSDLGLSQNPVRDLSPLAGTSTLSTLGLSGGQVTDISALAGKDGLRTLDLSGNRITDVSPLAGLPALDTVRLGQNAVVDPSPLGTVPTLLILDLFGNRIPDVGGLTRAPLLQELQLGANPLTDLTPLLAVDTLVNLGLDETDGTLLTGIEQLRAAGVSVNGLA